jgi:hypothetical protein
MMKRVLVALGVLVVLGIGLVMCSRVAERGRFVAAFSSYGSGPDGTRGLFLVSKARNPATQRWSEDLARLPRRAMVVALGSCKTPMARDLSRYEREAMTKWIEAGGVLLVAGSPTYLWDEAGVSIERAPECPQPGISLAELLNENPEEQPEKPIEPVAPVEPAFFEDVEPIPIAARGHGALEGLDRVSLMLAGSVAVASGEREVILDEGGTAHGVVVRKGRGTIIALSSASLFQNSSIEESEGAVVFDRIAQRYARDLPILFDEYHLGVGEKRSIMQYVRSVGGAAVFVQFLVVLLFFLWRRAARFGGPKLDAIDAPAGTASYVRAVGTLYERSNDRQGAIDRLVRHALLRVRDGHHLASSDAPHVATELDERGRKDEAAAVRKLDELATSARSGAKIDIVSTAREIDALVKKALPARV